jgi:hypothetical protein
MTTIAEHRENTKEALKMISTVMEAETGITYRRLVQAAERISGVNYWNAKDITMVDNNLDSLFGHNGWYPDIRQRFSPNLYITNWTKISENPSWNEEIYNRGLESGWAMIEYYMAKKAKNRVIG